jgi:prepilin-type N-terminal cleavage/methylation domain-containing protein
MGRADQKGYTLLELIAVVVLLALLSTFFVSRFTFNTSWSVDSSLRDLRNRIEFVLQDSLSRQVSYQIEFNVQENSYQVWEIKPLETGDVQQVDTLAGMRSSREQERRAQREELQAGLSMEEEFAREIFHDARPLDELFYQKIFDDPFGAHRRVPSLEYPGISEKVYLPPEVQITEVLMNQIPAPSLHSPVSRIVLLNPGSLQIHLEIQLSTERGPAVIHSDPFTNLIAISYI